MSGVARSRRPHSRRGRIVKRPERQWRFRSRQTGDEHDDNVVMGSIPRSIARPASATVTMRGGRCSWTITSIMCAATTLNGGARRRGDLLVGSRRGRRRARVLQRPQWAELPDQRTFTPPVDARTGAGTELVAAASPQRSFPRNSPRRSVGCRLHFRSSAPLRSIITKRVNMRPAASARESLATA